MSLTASERETIISFSDDDNTAYIYSAQRTVITKLKNNPAAVLIEEGAFEGSLWARFTMPAKLLSFRTTCTKRELSAEQREALASRMRSIRGSPGISHLKRMRQD